MTRVVTSRSKRAALGMSMARAHFFDGTRHSDGGPSDASLMPRSSALTEGDAAMVQMST